ERVDEVLRIGLRRGKRVGFELVLARAEAAERRDEEQKYGHREEEQQERETLIATQQRRPHAESLVEPHALREPAEQRQHREADRKRDEHPLDHMAALELAEFMREHGLDFAARQACEQRV